MDQGASSVISRETSSRIALSFEMRWRKVLRDEEALSGVKASRARLMNEAESRRKETTPSTFTTKKVKTLLDEVIASSLEAESAGPLKVDYGLAARTALQNVQQELATKEVDKWVRSELESKDLRGKNDILGKKTKEEDKQEPRKLGLKLNVISGKIFGMTEEGTKIMSIISVAGHQVVKNLVNRRRSRWYTWIFMRTT